ncbi:hypothetical protein N5B55_04670 [Ralstonia pickettii]|uniref:cobaltochelatase CobT-related protein n=1 Tax=Ralstonia pickettii TaxID=329 RepID=UPI002714DB4D|nr:hypothetical protein [Ralstonia pickettii]WKZ86246.1 hypothetical protein N5B55_04670 [Ralstonia pickettii]
MNDRIHILREAVVKVTQMLSGKGIQVTQRGVSAYVQPGPDGEPELVNLPYMPDNATDELVNAIQGFLDHEVAHILFSDFKALKKIKNERLHGIMNIIEDARIEKLMAQKFQGSASNLSNTAHFFLSKYITPRMQECAKKGDANGVVASLMAPLIRAMAGQQIFREFIDKHKAAVDPVLSKVAHLAPKIEDCASTEEAISLAQEFLKALSDGSGGGAGGEEESKKSSKSRSKGGIEKKGSKSKSRTGGAAGEEDESEDEGEADSGEGSAGEGKSKGSEGEGEGEESEDEGEGSGSGEGEEGEGEAEDSAAGEGEGDEGEEEGEGGGEEEDDSDDDSKETADGETTTGSTSALMDAIDKETKNGFDDAVSALISNAATDAAKHSDYLIYTKDFDVVEPLRVGREYDASMLSRLQDKVDHMVAPLQKDLERAIAARSLSTWENGRRSGRLHAANLSRLAVGDGRVFRRKTETTSKDVAVELVVDASGSMSGAKVHTAAQAAYALASVLDRIGIKSEVICFTTGECPISHVKLEEESDKIGKGFTRVEALYMPIIKGFNERMTATETKSRFAWLPNSNILRNNVDGECVEIAARRLLSRREAGKVMMVLSDGAPSCYSSNPRALQKHLKETVKKVEGSGVKVVGIGIMSTEVERFYSRSMVLNDVSELPQRVMKELRHLLLG